MHTYTAKQARAEFSALMDKAKSEPVMIEKNGRPAVVVLSAEDYTRLEALDDVWWGEKAKKAMKEGYIGVKKSQELIQRLLESKD